ncbi:DUF3856 domain-containing protein [Pelodictyon luteolum]|uniref:DUF3856 domain-containing protein n=1 Tax=Chlorobium luteolum (strain DSM 273 / BCRC 81028 / 2530) TaxID=319225 RepID=Q3B6N0_CHLL3|nr:DUF3856 domain-containing protein [Pelodictyon luteolum]ABB23001.1 conserved hypothetical protein [Pelodictyon luteolum DSM 273]
MKPLRSVADAYLALSVGERQLQDGLHAESAASCRSAMDAARSIPAEEAFDHAGFDAFVHAVLAGALTGLGDYGTGLESADLALYYFNRRGELEEDGGKLWIRAVFSRGAALEGLGRRDEAFQSFRMACEMLDERNGGMGGLEALRNAAAEALTRLGRATEPEKPAGYRAWWEFWS